MSPELGKPFPGAAERQAKHDGLVDFEKFLRFSASTGDKFRVTYSTADATKHTAFLLHLSELANVTDLEEVAVLEIPEIGSHTRVFDIHGISLSETTVLDEDGVVQEVSYEAARESHQPCGTLGTLMAAETLAVSPSVEV